MATRFGTAIVWLRRDLRLRDHAALARAARDAERIVCAFVLDDELLGSERVGAPIVAFFFEALAELRAALRARGSELGLLRGEFGAELLAFAKRVGAQAVYYNGDDDSSARARDERVEGTLRAAGLHAEALLDQTYFGAREVLAADERPYVMFAPYKRRWLERHAADPRRPYSTGRHSRNSRARSRSARRKGFPPLTSSVFAVCRGTPKAANARLARCSKRLRRTPSRGTISNETHPRSTQPHTCRRTCGPARSVFARASGRRSKHAPKRAAEPPATIPGSPN